MTDKQRQELYAAIDYDESDEVAAGPVPWLRPVPEMLHSPPQ